MILSVKVWKKLSLNSAVNKRPWEVPESHNLRRHAQPPGSPHSEHQFKWEAGLISSRLESRFQTRVMRNPGSSFSEDSSTCTLTSRAQTGDIPDSGSAFFSFIFSFHLLSFVSSLSTSDSTAVSRNNSRQRQVFTHVWVIRVSCSGKQVTRGFFLARRCSAVVGNSLRCLFFFLFYSFSQSEFVGEAREYSVLWRERVCSKLVDVSLQFDSSIDVPKWYC